MADRKRALGVPEQGKEWVSTLTGAHYRYVDGHWQFRRESDFGWSPVAAVAGNGTVYTYAGEYFEEVPLAQ